jgi:hypothetical protein
VKLLQPVAEGKIRVHVHVTEAVRRWEIMKLKFHLKLTFHPDSRYYQKLKIHAKLIFHPKSPPVFAIVVIFSSCTTAPVQIGDSSGTDFDRRNEVVRYAESLKGKKNIAQINKWFRNDCSGFVLGVYRTLGHRITLKPYPHTERITRILFHSLLDSGHTYNQKSPLKADVAFFRGTTEKSNGNISHVGIVTDVLEDGTILILNYTSRGVTELRMNLASPHIHTNEAGVIKNDYLKKKPVNGDGGKLLSGELFYCFGDLMTYSVY